MPELVIDEGDGLTIEETQRSIVIDQTVDRVIVEGEPEEVILDENETIIIDSPVVAITNVGGGGAGWIYIEAVETVDPTGGTSGAVYQDPPGNTVLQSITVSDSNIRITVKSSYPIVSFNGTPTTLSRDASGGFYSGSADVDIGGSGTISTVVTTPNDETGANDSCEVTVSSPPSLTTVEFTGGYPGTQTELKAGDSFNISVVADKNFDRVEISDFGACDADVLVVGATSSTVVASTIADRGDVVQALPARVRVRDAVTGAWSSTRDTDFGGGTVDGTNLVNCNNLYPSVGWGSVSYPGAQQALKATESATIPLTASDYDSLVVAPIGGDLSVVVGAPPTVTVQRAGGSYNVSADNLRATATRDANDATTVVDTIVQIAAVAPTISVVSPAARLRSGGNDGTSVQAHTITINSDQELLSTPTLNADSGGNRGTFVGSWSGGPSSYTRSLEVDETVPDEKGVFAFEGLVATGLAGIVQNTIGSGAAYTLGGFVARDVDWQAFQTISDSVGVEIADFSKIQAGLWQASGNQSIRQPIGTSPPVVEGYTSDDPVGTNPHQLEWLDTVRASSNSGVASLFDYEEVV